ncbi:unnamed protein product [Prunus armeniaca]
MSFATFDMIGNFGECSFHQPNKLNHTFFGFLAGSNKYLSTLWGKVLQCVNHEGLQLSRKVSEMVIKERFKCFNTLFDEIHKTHSTWVVSYEQLQSELSVLVLAVVILAYRSFWGRFR